MVFDETDSDTERRGEEAVSVILPGGPVDHTVGNNESVRKLACLLDVAVA